MIYFLRKPDGSAIKIGTTIRLGERLRQLAVEHGPGLEVLAVVEGSFEKECALHRQFAHLRTVGEWFEPGDDLLGFIVSDGKPWDRSEGAHQPLAGVRVEPDALELAKLAATEVGETVGVFISRVVKREAAQIIENLTPVNAAKKVERARQVMQGDSADPVQPAPPADPGPAKAKGKGRKGGD